MGTLYYGDNLDILQRYVADESIDLPENSPALQRWECTPLEAPSPAGTAERCTR